MELTVKQQRILDVYRSTRNKAATAKKLGISRSTVRSYLRIIKEKGIVILPETSDEHTPIGFTLTNTTQHIKRDQEGNSWIAQEWPRSSAALNHTELILESLKQRTPISEFTCDIPQDSNEDLMLEWCLADLHHGMKASEEETGQKHNVEMSRTMVEQAAADIFHRAGEVSLTRIISIGDFFHSDFFKNKTEKSGHSLWTSDTFVNIARCGVEAIEAAVELALLKSDTVELDFLGGNHCQQSSAWLQLLLEKRYEGHGRVSVSFDQSLARFKRWGVNFFGYHHGHTTNGNRLALETLAKAAKSGEYTRWFFARTAHLHNQNRMLLTTSDEGGVILERIPTLAPRDKFTADGCYNSCRGTVANLFHKKFGLRARIDTFPENLDYIK